MKLRYIVHFLKFMNKDIGLFGSCNPKCSVCQDERNLFEEENCSCEDMMGHIEDNYSKNGLCEQIDRQFEKEMEILNES